MKKLIINETDCHGCGEYYFDGKIGDYSYDDGESGDLRATVQFLIDIGFIDPNRVEMFSSDDCLIEKYGKMIEEKE